MSPRKVAPLLLGKYLVRIIDGEKLIGMIVETESYLGPIDPASHSFKGKTKRNGVLFGKAGIVYVHQIHRYNCLDIVTEDEHHPTSVLIRALEPIEGIEQMKKNRGTDDIKSLTNGPGKLSMALDITRELNGMDVTKSSSPLFIADAGIKILKKDIGQSKRIGISKGKEMELRFFVKNNPFLSR